MTSPSSTAAVFMLNWFQLEQKQQDAQIQPYNAASISPPLALHHEASSRILKARFTQTNIPSHCSLNRRKLVRCLS